MKKLLIVLVTVVLICTSTTAFASSDVLVISDAFIVRPLGFLALAGGTALYIASLPIALITRSEPETKKLLLEEPYRFTFKRPLGDTGAQTRR